MNFIPDEDFTWTKNTYYIKLNESKCYSFDFNFTNLKFGVFIEVKSELNVIQILVFVENLPHKGINLHINAEIKDLKIKSESEFKFNENHQQNLIEIHYFDHEPKLYKLEMTFRQKCYNSDQPEKKHKKKENSFINTLSSLLSSFLIPRSFVREPNKSNIKSTELHKGTYLSPKLGEFEDDFSSQNSEEYSPKLVDSNIFTQNNFQNYPKQNNTISHKQKHNLPEFSNVDDDNDDVIHDDEIHNDDINDSQITKKSTNSNFELPHKKHDIHISPDFTKNEFKFKNFKSQKSKSNIENFEPPSFDNIKANYAGLLNQGATCYMNSILQVLFHLPAFRKLIFSIDSSTNDVDDTKNVILNLQLLFGLLQTTKGPVATKFLTDSFGWSISETGTQQDVDEFCRELLDNISEKLKNTEYEGKIDELFGGICRNYIRGETKDFEEKADDKFTVFSIVVKGMNNLNDSFHAAFQKQKLENEYESQLFGKQEASLFPRFFKFPKVLFIHLKRFEIQIENGQAQNKKINSFFEFNPEIDITQYLSDECVDKNETPETHPNNYIDNKFNENRFGKTNDTAKKESGIYDLFGVLVHVGSANSGHYYAFIRPTTEKQWYQFNDSSVTFASEKQAINQNFGDFYDERNAYMLVYVKRDYINDIFIDFPLEIPEKVQNLIQRYETENDKININLVSKLNMKNNGLKARISFFCSIKNMFTIDISKSMTTKELYLLIAQNYNNCSPDSFSLWTFKDDCLVEEIENSSTTKVSDIETQSNGLTFYILDSIQETSNPPNHIAHNNNSSFSLFSKSKQSNSKKPVIFYLYDSKSHHPLIYLGSNYVNTNDNVNQYCSDFILRNLEYNADFYNDIEVYYKKMNSLVPVDRHYRFSSVSNSIFVINTKSRVTHEFFDSDSPYSKKYIHFLDVVDRMPANPSEYFQLSHQLMTSKITLINNYDEFPIKFPYMITFNIFCCFIKKIIRTKHEIAIYTKNSQEPLTSSLNEKLLSSIIEPFIDELFVFFSPVKNFQKLLIIKISIDSLYVIDQHFFFFNEDETVGDLMNRMNHEYHLLNERDAIDLCDVNSLNNNHRKFRLIQINNGLMEKIIDDYSIPLDFLEYPVLRFEPVPENQKAIESRFLIPVSFLKKSMKPNFFIDLIEGEIFGLMKDRILSFMNFNDEIDQEMTFYLFSSKNNKSVILNEKDIITNLMEEGYKYRIEISSKEKSHRTSSVKIHN
ncbi:hypothetical protein TRFO_13801 [Tritrichomonas foetus]|uniref:USP domain-containing protein n=1 Tax=Tritrichomonas foetus TaxID=1144522 RepID=A0A1J4KX88_9EUKA|nr:hypothetical protein TRFO_13801 [Tritrichomonas foetus]|eukprot:OHT15794.1 hypothetical protein TRFO_13801 [Tritrichomonas foetus]